MRVYKYFWLISLFLFTNSGYSNQAPFERDQFLFKIIDEIYTLKEVEEFYTLLKDLECINKDFLILKVLPEEFLKQTKSAEVFRTAMFSKDKSIFTVNQIYVFNILKRVIKLGTYVSSQNIELDKNLIPLNKQLAKEKGCRYEPAKSLLSQSVYDSYWKMLMQIEVFLNVQFSSSSTSEEERKKIQKEKKRDIVFLIDSIEKQIKEVLFW